MNSKFKKGLLIAGFGIVGLGSLAAISIYNVSNIVQNNFQPGVEKVSSLNIIGTATSTQFERGFFTSKATSEWVDELNRKRVLNHEIKNGLLSATITTTMSTDGQSIIYDVPNPSESPFVIVTNVGLSGNTSSELTYQDTVINVQDKGDISFKSMKGRVNTKSKAFEFDFSVDEVNTAVESKGVIAKGFHIKGESDYELVNAKIVVNAKQLEIVQPDEENLIYENFELEFGTKLLNNGFKFFASNSLSAIEENIEQSSDFGFKKTNLAFSLASKDKDIVELLKKDEPNEAELLNALIKSEPSFRLNDFNIEYYSDNKLKVMQVNGDLNLSVPEAIDPMILVAMPIQALKFLKGEVKIDAEEAVMSQVLGLIGLPEDLISSSTSSTKNIGNKKTKIKFANGSVKVNGNEIM